MRFLVKIILFFACGLSLFANTLRNNHYDFEAQILNELNIHQSFMQTKYYSEIKRGINDNSINDFMRTIKRGYNNVPVVRAMIDNSSIPNTFFYLAMIESGFSNHVVSSAKATGVWQFMSQTARNYGLKVDKYVDERRDPINSTKAAIRYLNTLKSHFGKWYLAILAYNCGEGKLARAIKKAGSDDLVVLLDPKKRYLPEETRKFIIKILRASFIANEATIIASKEFKQIALSGDTRLVKVNVPGGTNLMQIGDIIGLSVKKMKENNPHLKFVFTPPNTKNYHIYVPKNKLTLFARNFKPFKGENKFYTYVVKKGDTLLSISKKSGVSHRAIKDYNELASNSIKVNDRLIIPASSKNAIKTYRVQTGDTLAGLSEKFDVDENKLKEVNSFASSDLKAGAKIVIP